MRACPYFACEQTVDCGRQLVPRIVMARSVHMQMIRALIAHVGVVAFEFGYHLGVGLQSPARGHALRMLYAAQILS